MYVSCNKRSIQDGQSTKSTKSISLEFKASELIRLIVALSVEHLKSFHEILSRDYGSVSTIFTKDYEAMHAYQCGMYDRCVEICEQNIQACERKEAQFFVPITGCMTYLMDSNLASLSALVWLHSRNTENLKVLQITKAVYLELSSNIQLQYPASSLIAQLRNVKILHDLCATHGATCDRFLMCFAYRMTLIHMAKSAINRL
jgi:hypothetical protein